MEKLARVFFQALAKDLILNAAFSQNGGKAFVVAFTHFVYVDAEEKPSNVGEKKC